MLRSSAADAPSPGARAGREAAGPECHPSPTPDRVDAAASPSTPAAYGRTPAPGLSGEADPGPSRLGETSHGAASTGGRSGASAAGEGEQRVLDRNGHAEGGLLGGRGGGGQAAPDSPAAQPDDGRDRHRRRAGREDQAGSGSELEAVVLGHHMVDFWTNVCVCHTLIVEAGAGAEGAGPPIYQVCR